MKEKRVEEAALFLPEKLRRAFFELAETVRAQAEELRLRKGNPLQIVCSCTEIAVKGTNITDNDLQETLDLATAFSRYTASESMRNGFFTARGGFRVGVCGSMLLANGVPQQIWPVSSLSIRIPRQCRGFADGLLPQIFCCGELCSTLIVSPPGGGKTTLLRDLVRLVSDGSPLFAPRRVSLVDERGELAAIWQGEAQLDVGRHTDILDGCTKAAAIPILLRAMNPQVIALDEVALPADVDAVRAAAGCGVKLLATCHARDREDLMRGSIGRSLLQIDVFRRLVTLSGTGSARTYETEEIL